MATAISNDIREIAAALSSEQGGVLDLNSLRWLRDPSEHLVPDAVLALYLDGHKARDHAVLLVANPQFPDAVADAISNATSVMARLQPETAAHVLRPVASGQHGTQSYGLYTRLEPMSGNKFVRLAQKNVAAPRITRWLQDVAQQTRQDIADEARKETQFHAPMRFLAQDPDIPNDVKSAVRVWLEQIERGDTPLFSIVEHGDFWIGNVLYDPSPLPGVIGSFRVIDWGGTQMDGHAGIDLLRYCMSCFRSNARQPKTLMTGYMDALNIPEPARGLHPMASMGQLGMNLDQFPKKRYVALVREVFELLSSVGMVPRT